MAHFYNEHDRQAAAWLRELIKNGLIADGTVDDRDIRDLQPADLVGFTQCHFFAGIGGWSYALRLAGWPDDQPVWTGSCPCQPFSAAGAHAGGDDPRHLWPAWFRLIKECRPDVVFGEQVESAIAHGWLDLVCDDLEREGYAVGAVGLPACSLGAPHIRQRLWFVADAGCGPDERRSGPRKASGAQRQAQGQAPQPERGRLAVGTGGASGGLADASRWRVEGRRVCRPREGDQAVERSEAEQRPERASASGELADAEHSVWGQNYAHRPNGCDGKDVGRNEAAGEPGARGEVHGMADASNPRRGRGATVGHESSQEVLGGPPILGAVGELAESAHGTGGQRERDARKVGSEKRQEGAAGDTSPSTAAYRGAVGELGHATAERLQGSTAPDLSGERRGREGRAVEPSGLWRVGDSSGQGREELSGNQQGPRPPWADLIWLPCRDGKARPTQPGLHPLAHGVPGRVGRLRGYGNAIVPHVAAEVIAAYMKKETL